MGVALGLVGRLPVQSRRPVLISKAYSSGASVLPTKTTPPPLEMGPRSETDPPSFGVLGLKLPSGTRHLISPVEAEIAVRVLQGGGLQGRCFGLRRSRRIMPYGVPRCGANSQSPLSLRFRELRMLS